MASLLAALTLALCAAASSAAGGDAVPCSPRDFSYGSVVCVCNSTYCDTLPRFQRPPPDSALVYTSTQGGLRFHKKTVPIQAGLGKSGQRLTIDRSTKYQKIKGFGGAFTDATGINLKSLPDAAQENLLRSYFSEDGLEYNMGRVPIGGCDFSTRKYAYQEDSNDKTLKDFQLQSEDYEYKIPVVRRAMELLPRDAGDLLLVGATWSPPPWMKTSGKIEGFGFLKLTCYQSYADYHIKFLDAYEKENVTFFAISTGNEPLNGVLPVYGFNALGWLPKWHRQWIAEHMGPTLKASRHAKVSLLALDDQRYLLPWWLNKVMDEQVSRYVDGVAVHWYANFITPSSLLDKVHEQHPDKFIISTEASNGDKPWDFTKVKLGSWARGVLYMDDIIDVMNHWVSGWVDWNLALDMQGGPNWKKNFVDSAIIIDSEKGEFYKQPTYYALGHFSKFVPRDSQRVSVKSEGGIFLLGNVQYTAFERPDGGVTVVLLNKHNTARDVVIQEEGRGHIALEVPAHSFTTVLYWGSAGSGSSAGFTTSYGAVLGSSVIALLLARILAV